MKLSDYIAQFLAEKGTSHVFALSGGASLHLIHSVAKHPQLDHVCLQHEQACAMAADGYARSTGKVGVCFATSGPGATNLLTGICSAYYDSVPSLFVTGQVATFRQKGQTGVRQIGFQETDVVPMFKHVTNYAVALEDPHDIAYELEKAWDLATQGRPGPVLLDIPDNFQREDIDLKRLRHYTPPARPEAGLTEALDNAAQTAADWLAKAKRPILVLGWGVRLAEAESAIERIIEQTHVPVALTWGMADFMEGDDPLSVGTFGTHGTRYANFAVQNADLILSIGSRLDTKATGSPVSSFAREAKKIMVDIDSHELEKFQSFDLTIDLPICADAKVFAQALLAKVSGVNPDRFDEWRSTVKDWKARYPICPGNYLKEKAINPYAFVQSLAGALPEEEEIFIDTGCPAAWMMQSFSCKKGQRLFHDCNNTAMGWALPAAIGASMAKGNKPVTCIVGDGSLHMNLQELATVIRHQLPIKIYLFNNHGHSMIRQTQDQWLDSQYIASSVEGGLADVDFVAIAQAYGFETHQAAENLDAQAVIEKMISSTVASFCHLEIDPEHRVIPQVKFGRPNEDTEPLLERSEFLANMLVEPLPCSLPVQAHEHEPVMEGE